jgi:hypothetical protein
MANGKSTTALLGLRLATTTAKGSVCPKKWREGDLSLPTRENPCKGQGFSPGLACLSGREGHPSASSLLIG